MLDWEDRWQVTEWGLESGNAVPYFWFIRVVQLHQFSRYQEAILVKCSCCWSKCVHFVYLRGNTNHILPFTYVSCGSSKFTFPMLWVLGLEFLENHPSIHISLFIDIPLSAPHNFFPSTHTQPYPRNLRNAWACKEKHRGALIKGITLLLALVIAYWCQKGSAVRIRGLSCIFLALLTVWPLIL